MTKNQIVHLQDQYQLVDFIEGGNIQFREVVFWHALIKDNYLKIVVYDIINKTVIQRLHDLTKPQYHCDWFLIEDGFFEEDLLDFI